MFRKLADLMCIFHAWRKNTMLETENKEIPVKLLKFVYFSFLSESQNPKQSRPNVHLSRLA